MIALWMCSSKDFGGHKIRLNALDISPAGCSKRQLESVGVRVKLDELLSCSKRYKYGERLIELLDYIEWRARKWVVPHLIET